MATNSKRCPCGKYGADVKEHRCPLRTLVPAPTGRIKKLIERPRRLSRNERLQEAADAGFDTWDDYRGER